MANNSRIYLNTLTIKETRDFLKESLKARLGAEFDAKVWTKAWAKYKRFCDLYNDVALYSREMEERGEGMCLEQLLEFYEESSVKAKVTFNREHRKELNWAK
jgi:hypothetical protein